MSEWVDLFHVLSEIVLVLIIVRLQYELFCVRTAIQKFRWFVGWLAFGVISYVVFRILYYVLGVIG